MTRAKLNARLLESGPPVAGVRFPSPATCQLPERVLQFGEGNFLRGFTDWMIHRMTELGLFGGRIVVVQPIAAGMADALNAQDGVYTVVLRGLQAGQIIDTREVVGSVSRAIDPYTDFASYLECATNPRLRFVISNTTEAGIRCDPADSLDGRPAPSFPGKLTQLLFARYQHFAGDPSRGLVMLPCELLERNGDALAEAVRTTARNFGLPPEFFSWLDSGCVFANTLVDRIVTGFPKTDPELIESLGYDDGLIVTGEPYHAWIIEASTKVRTELPLTEAGLNVTWTTDITPYRERKVRILNGAHTLMVLAGYLADLDTVRQCMDDPLVRAFVQEGLELEILPTVRLPKHDVDAFAKAVVERFCNPFIRHAVLSISLNSVSKYKARLLGCVLDFMRDRSQPPTRLAFGLAALMAFYRGRVPYEGELQKLGAPTGLVGMRDGQLYPIQDETRVLEFFAREWSGHLAGPVDLAFCREFVARFLARDDFWGLDVTSALPGFAELVAEHLLTIVREGVRPAMQRIVQTG